MVVIAVILWFALLKRHSMTCLLGLCIYHRQRPGLYRSVYDWIKPELKSGFICWEKTMLHLLLIAAFKSQFPRVARYKKICLLALFTMSKLLLSSDGFETLSLGYSAVFCYGSYVKLVSSIVVLGIFVRWCPFWSAWFCMCMQVVFVCRTLCYSCVRSAWKSFSIDCAFRFYIVCSPFLEPWLKQP